MNVKKTAWIIAVHPRKCDDLLNAELLQKRSTVLLKRDYVLSIGHS